MQLHVYAQWFIMTLIAEMRLQKQHAHYASRQPMLYVHVYTWYHGIVLCTFMYLCKHGLVTCSQVSLLASYMSAARDTCMHTRDKEPLNW